MLSTAVALSSIPNRFSPAYASKVAETLPSSSFRSLVCTLPLKFSTCVWHLIWRSHQWLLTTLDPCLTIQTLHNHNRDLRQILPSSVHVAVISYDIPSRRGICWEFGLDDASLLSQRLHHLGVLRASWRWGWWRHLWRPPSQGCSPLAFPLADMWARPTAIPTIHYMQIHDWLRAPATYSKTSQSSTWFSWLWSFSTYKLEVHEYSCMSVWRVSCSRAMLKLERILASEGNSPSLSALLCLFSHP